MQLELLQLMRYFNTVQANGFSFHLLECLDRTWSKLKQNPSLISLKFVLKCTKPLECSLKRTGWRFLLRLMM